MLLTVVNASGDLRAGPRGSRGYEHAVDINGITRLTAVFTDVRAKRGEIVGLRMDPAGGHLFPVEPRIFAERASGACCRYVLTSRNTVRPGTCLTDSIR